MSHGSCVAITASATGMLNSGQGRQQTLELLEADAPAEAFVEMLAAQCDAEMADLVREEFRELPSTLVATIVDAWAMAESASKQFVLQSVVPASPLEFARNRRVRIAVDVDEQGVTVSLSHIPGRHAQWAQVAARTA